MHGESVEVCEANLGAEQETDTGGLTNIKVQLLSNQFTLINFLIFQSVEDQTISKCFGRMAGLSSAVVERVLRICTQVQVLLHC